jgi:hypothetical protein
MANRPIDLLETELIALLAKGIQEGVSAPRPLRIDAIDKIPDLLDKLAKAADKTTRKLTEKMAQAQELAEALKTAADELTQPKKARRS